VPAQQKRNGGLVDAHVGRDVGVVFGGGQRQLGERVHGVGAAVQSQQHRLERLAALGVVGLDCQRCAHVEQQLVHELPHHVVALHAHLERRSSGASLGRRSGASLGAASTSGSSARRCFVNFWLRGRIAAGGC
jgi:hypothetical protein